MQIPNFYYLNNSIYAIQENIYLMKAMTMYVAKLFVYFTLNDISGVTLVFCKSWFVLV